MVLRLFWIYVVAEVAAVAALAWAIGVGWTLLILVSTFLIGLAVAGSQIKRHVRRLRDGFATPQGAISDSAIVALGTTLVVVPGLVSSALGVLLLLPPTRAVARPAVTFLALRGMAKRAPLITAATAGAGRYYGHGRGDYIDGEVIDVHDYEPPAIPRDPS
jgi:UPF0716 protein FxsA